MKLKSTQPRQQRQRKRSRCISSLAQALKEEHIIPSSKASFSDASTSHHFKHRGQEAAPCFKQQMSLTNILREEHNKERSDQVIDSLYIAAGWVSNGPDKQDSFKDLGKNEGKQVPALAVHKGKAEKHNC